jgi:hypothetical protein
MYILNGPDAAREEEENRLAEVEKKCNSIYIPHVAYSQFVKKK